MYYPNDSQSAEHIVYLSRSGDRRIRAASYRLMIGHTSRLDGLARVTEAEQAAAEQRDRAAFLCGRNVMASQGLQLCQPEAYWRDKPHIDLKRPQVGYDGMGARAPGEVLRITEADCRAASAYPDDAGCLYFYLYRLLRPTTDMLG